MIDETELRKGQSGRRGVVVLVTLMLAAAVVGPLTRGRLFLLDWVIGPHSTLPRTAWGLDGGVTNGLPFMGLTLAAERVIGGAATWLPFALFFPLAGFAVSRLAGGSTTAKVAAALVYCVNPVVFDRAAVGQFPFLFAYALLPLIVRSVVAASEDPALRRTGAALLLGVAIAASPHFVWIGAIVTVVGFCLRRITWRRAICFFASWGSVAAMSSYMLVLSMAGDGGFTVGADDLLAYRTVADPTLGLVANVIGLYGFWRIGPTLGKSVVAGWPVILIALLVVVAAGASRALRDPARRPLASLLVASAAMGLLLAMGSQGPSGFLFQWLFDHVPFFAIMREPQKFIVLVALAYAVLFGWGVEWLVKRNSGILAVATASGVLFLLPIAYTPTLFWGLGGQVRSVPLPADWAAVDQTMGNGVGRVLVLPWHQYLAFEFTGRVITNPGDALLRRDVIVGDNVELPGLRTSSTSARSQYLEYLYNHGNSMCSFGQLTAPLGVEFILLAKTVDYTSYGWLAAQRDLEVVEDTRDLTLYRNRSWRGGAIVGDPVVFEHWGELVTASDLGEIGRPVIAAETTAAPSPAPCAPMPSPAARPVQLSAPSPVRYEVEANGRGLIGLPEAPDPSWRMQGERPVPLAGGVSGFPFQGGMAEAVFRHWSGVRVSYAVSLAMALLLLGVEVSDRWPWRRTPDSDTGDDPARS